MFDSADCFERAADWIEYLSALGEVGRRGNLGADNGVRELRGGAGAGVPERGTGVWNWSEDI